MKSKTLQKVLAIFLALGMLISYLPISASAQAPVAQDGIALSKDTRPVDAEYLSLSDSTPFDVGLTDIEFKYDDGTGESGIGTQAATYGLIGLNRFKPGTQFPFMLTEISFLADTVLYGSAMDVGDPVRLVVFKNTNTEGIPDPSVGAELLLDTPTTVKASTGWNTYQLADPVLLEGPGDILVGYVFSPKPAAAATGGYFPAIIDDDTVLSNTSFLGLWQGAAPTPITIPSPSPNWGSIESFNFPGVLAIRAKGVPVGDYELTGTVTNSLAAPVVDATITLNPGGRTATTNASGVYSMMVDAGDYTVTAGKFGYLDQTKPVSIPEGATAPVVLDFQLEGLSNITVKGVVTDGGMDAVNKHGYPLHTKITFSTTGDTQVVYTHPLTGAYEVILLSGNEYTAKVEAMVNGYAVLNETFTPIGETEFVQNFAVPINIGACVAPGYEKEYDLAFYDFETGPQGFTFGGTNSTWAHGMFTPITNGPTTAHSGDYGIATNPAGQYVNSELSWAKSPVIDLSGLGADQAVVLEWWQWLYTESATSTWDVASVEFTKNGTTWTPVWGPFPRQDKEWKLEKLVIEPEYFTDKFQFRFWFKSDSSGLQAGWYVDDIGLGIVEGVPPATPVITYNFDDADEEAWTTGSTGTGANTWAKGVPAAGPSAPNTPPNLWATNLNGYYNNYEVSFITSPVIDMSAYAGGAIEVKYFDWLETESATSTYDVGRLKATADGTTWDTLLDNILRKDVAGTPMTSRKIVLDPKYTTKDFQFRFEFKSDVTGNSFQGWYIDSVQFGATEPFVADISCVPQAGGVVAGYAIDHWEEEKMYDVRVESENAVAVTKTLSGHPESDGLYWLFQPFTGTGATETVEFTASKEKFGVETADVVVKKSQIVRQDWELSSGKLVATPEALERTIALFDDPETTTLTIENLGAVDSTFSLSEFNVGFQPYSIPPFTGEIQSSEQSSLLTDPGLTTKAATKLESTGMLPIIMEGGPQAFALEIRSSKQLKRIPDITVPGTWESVGAVAESYYAGDFLKDDYSKIYAVSDANAFVTIDTATGAITPIKTITPPGDTVSGLAGANGFFYGISGTQIFTLDTEGNLNVIATTTATLGIDLAYVPDNGLLYTVDLQSDHLFSINPNTGESVDIGALGFNANYAQGMDYDEVNKVLYWAAYGGGGDGQLRAIDINTGASVLVGNFSGDNETDCLSIAAYAGGGGGGTGGAVPWLTETPEEGLVDGLGTFEIEIEFNVNDIEQPGDYFAELRFTNDTPYELPAIPVTMHVVRPLNWGNIKANIYALEQCDIEPAPAEKAGVNFYQNGQLVASIETNEDGYFSYALKHGTYDVEILKVGYVPQMIDDVVVGWDEDTILDDINLRLDAACLIVDPDSIYQEQFPDRITEQTLTFINIGAAETVFEITEKDMGGPTPFRTMADEVNLIIDDGSYDNALGVGGTADFISVNRFTPAADQFPMTLTEVSVYFEGSTVASGQTFKVVMYENTAASSDPAVGSKLLHQQAATVGSVPGWTVVTLDQPVVFEGPGDVLIGAIFTHKPGVDYFPAAMDQTTLQKRSWVGYWVAEDSPAVPNLPPDDAWLLVDDAGFAGNWMIRAKGTTGGGGGGGGTGGDILWLDIDVLADVVMPDGGEVEVTLTFDSTGLTTGDYFGELLVTNAPDPRITIPVQLRIWDFNRIFAPFTVTRYPHPSK